MRPCTLYSIDFCALDSGKHKQMWMCKWDPDAVARFNLTTNSCVLLDALCSELCSLCSVLVLFVDRSCRTHGRIDYNGFALAFISDQYIIYTIYAYKFVRLHVLNFGFANTHREIHFGLNNKRTLLVQTFSADRCVHIAVSVLRLIRFAIIGVLLLNCLRTSWNKNCSA